MGIMADVNRCDRANCRLYDVHWATCRNQRRRTNRQRRQQLFLGCDSIFNGTILFDFVILRLNSRHRGASTVNLPADFANRTTAAQHIWHVERVWRRARRFNFDNLCNHRHICSGANFPLRHNLIWCASQPEAGFSKEIKARHNWVFIKF